MTFPGESIALDWANPISGTITDYGDPIRYRAGEDTLTAGTSFIAGFFDYYVIDDPGEVVEASIVIVTKAGTSGQVRVSYGLDPGRHLDDPALATQALGTHTVTGATDLVLPIPSFDVANLLAGIEESIAFVEVLSGTLVVEQIKLRLWPPGGITGAWVPGPDVEGETTPVRRGTVAGGIGSVDEEDADFSMDGAFAVAQANYAGAAQSVSAPITPYTFEGVQYSGLSAQGYTENAIDPSDFLEFYEVGLEALSIWVATSVEDDPVGFLSGVTTDRHPDEVPGDPLAYVQAPGGGPVYRQVTGWTHDVRLDGISTAADPVDAGRASAVAATIPSGETVIVAGTVRWAFDTPYLPTNPPSGTTVAVGETASLSLPAAASVRIDAGSYTWFERPANSSGALAVRIPSALKALTLATGYVYWDPDAVEEVEIPLRIRQRGDGLGMGGPRVRGIGSRQRSVRVRGYV